MKRRISSGGRAAGTDPLVLVVVAVGGTWEGGEGRGLNNSSFRHWRGWLERHGLAEMAKGLISHTGFYQPGSAQ
jgi:hypothetical protein